MVKINLNLKKKLLHANKSLSNAVTIINHQSDFWFLWDRSLPPGDRYLFDVERAILFLEDRRFVSHYGAELRMIPRLFRRVLSGKRLGGISTIDQQVIRIVRNRYERTIRRKAGELALATLLNAHLTKRKIFHFYIHFAYLGYGMEGVEVASRKLFSKKAANLSPNEACFVAALFARPVPKSVVQKVISNVKIYTPEEIFEIARFSGSEKWAEKAKARYEYALNNYVRIPNSLFIK